MLARTAIYAMLFIAQSTTVTHAEMSGTEFLKTYDTGSPDGQTVWRLMAQSVSNGIAWADAAKPGPPLYCPPGKLALTSEQVIQILRSEIDEHPEAASFPYGLGILAGLQNTFPCKKP